MNFCKVAVDFPVRQSVLTYSIESDKELSVGKVVEVPLGRRNALGVVLETFQEDEKYSQQTDFKVKNILKNEIEGSFDLSEKEIELYSWMSKYYHYSLGQLVFDCLPKFMKRPKDVKFFSGQGEEFPFQLNHLQKNYFDTISNQLKDGFNKFLIHGVTGSGKTAIYLKLINKVLKEGKSVIFLLPEINLTPQFISTLLRHTLGEILPYHSALSNSEKYRVWDKLKKENGPFVVLGMRSSVFLPVENLGLIIVDEEHDQSFKQTDRCTYNGRDVAIKKAQIFKIPIVLGSATPSLESFYSFNCQNKENYFSLPNRVSTGKLPNIELIDAREKSVNELIWPFHDKSIEAISEALKKEEQVLVFVGRLGYASYVQCHGCGYRFLDPNSDTLLRYFKEKRELVSAYSDYKISVPESCPECGNLHLIQKGFGTEKVAEILQYVFKDSKVDRFDRDEIKNHDQLVKKLRDFNNGEIDILVGTQMLSKGHNFEKVNLVIVLGIDSILNFPDFRAIEKGYQLLKQVSGRSGRFGHHSKVLIQTLNPENKIFEYLTAHDFDQFYHDELKIRELVDYPPFSRLIAFFITSRFRDKLMAEAISMKNKLENVCRKELLPIQVLGPSPCMIEKKANRFTWIILLKSNNLEMLHRMTEFFLMHYKLPSDFSLKVDTDPQLSL